MNYETYANLIRVAERRVRSARITGNRKALAEACEERERIRLMYETSNKIKP